MNGGKPGSASAGGAGQGDVQNGVATGTGTGIAQAGPGQIIPSLHIKLVTK